MAADLRTDGADPCFHADGSREIFWNCWLTGCWSGAAVTLKERFVVEVVKEGARRTGGRRAIKVLDLGCGAAAYVPMLIRECPDIQYVGVEPIHSSYRAAVRNIEGIPTARVHCQLGYDGIPREDAGSFDVVFSLSVLEHVKRLD